MCKFKVNSINISHILKQLRSRNRGFREIISYRNISPSFTIYTKKFSNLSRYICDWIVFVCPLSVLSINRREFFEVKLRSWIVFVLFVQSHMFRLKATLFQRAHGAGKDWKSEANGRSEQSVHPMPVGSTVSWRRFPSIFRICVVLLILIVSSALRAHCARRP